MKKLGKLPAKSTTNSLARKFMMYGALERLGAAPMSSPDWVNSVIAQSPTGWGMFGNDMYGDCVFADCAHSWMLWTANTGKIWIPTIEQVLQLYSDCTGFNPGDPNTDQGANELDVITYLTKQGWLGHKLDAHADILHTNVNHIKWGINIFGAVRLGIAVTQAMMDAFDNNQPWTKFNDQNIIGGHDVPLVKYTGDTLFCVTWGRLHPIDISFFSSYYDDGTPYVDEAHAQLAFDWLNKTGTAPSKLNLKQLIDDLQQVAD